MPVRNLTTLLIAAAVCYLCYGEAGRNRYASILSESMDKISHFYVEPVDSRTLFEGGMNGMLSRLDPYSGYIPPESYQQFQVDIQQEFGGVGIEVGMEDGRLIVLSPVPGTPAYDAGLMAGDVIIAIDGNSTEGFSLEEAVTLMRGPIGSQVAMTLQRVNEEAPIEVSLARARILIESVRGDRRRDDGRWEFTLEDYPHIGYVRLTSFGDHTAADLRSTLDGLRGQINALVIDLRGNAGGLLNSAVDICDIFLPAEELVVSTRGRALPKPEEFFSVNPPLFDPQIPMVILVDRFSASASEIVAACLQDKGRAAIVGERTWGKGTVQNVIELEGGRSAMRLTTQTYWRPSGKNIHRHRNDTEEDAWGVSPEPEQTLSLSTEQYIALSQQRRIRDTAPARRRPIADGESNELRPIEEVDLQLALAMEWLLAK